VTQDVHKLDGLYAGIAATVMGLGRFGGGVAAARFLAQHGALVTVTDLRPAADLEDSIAALSDVRIHRWALGEHPLDVFQGCQLLVANPAVRPDNAFVIEAIQRGADVTTEIELFLRHNPAPVIAVTGSNGKSTTTALIHHLLKGSPTDEEPNSGFRRIWLGGNIGISLLDQLPQITDEDIAVLELSSFQLETLRRKRFRPQIAVLTNFSPNHLDWHGTVAHYRTAKQAIFDFQTADDVAIVPGDDENPADGAQPIVWKTRGQRMQFGLVDQGEDGVFFDDGNLILRAARGTFEDSVRLTIPAQLPGAHNALNVAAATCAAWQAGANPESFSASLKTFQPLPHRLQLVAEHAGRQFWNDSIATTPESAIMALRVFSGRAVLLAGGYDKGQDLREFANEIKVHAKAVVLMGKTAESLKTLLDSGGQSATLPTIVAGDFAEAFARAVVLSNPGDIVLLSPGCASYGWFRDYRERGELFCQFAREWRPVE
jgi:UDP-N-acetylmuramoylalanine--D-glutamate ligase